MATELAALPPPPPESAVGQYTNLPPPPPGEMVQQYTALPPPPPPSVAQQYTAPQQHGAYRQIQETSDRHWWEAPLVGTEQMTDAEIRAIAEKHGVDYSALREAAPLMGGRTESQTEPGTEEMIPGLASAAGRSILMGLPQFALKKSVDDPHLRDALDDVRELADAKRSILQSGVEMMAPGGAIHGLGAGLRGLAAGGAATGAIYGATGSREGEEASGAAVGAGLGAALGLGAGLVTRKLAGMATRDAEKTTPDLIKEGVASRAIEIEKGTDQVLEENRPLNNIRREFVLSGTESTPDLLYRAERALPEKIVSETPADQLGLVAGKDLQDTAIAFANHIAKEVDRETTSELGTAVETVNAFGKQIGPEALEKTYSDWERLRAGQEYLEKNELRADPDPFGGLHRVAEVISGAQNIFKIADEKFGTNLYPEFLRYNEGKNRSTFAQAGAEKLAAEPTKEMERRKIDPQEIGRMLDGSLEVSEAAAPVVEKWREVLDKTRELLRSGDKEAKVPGLPIRFLEEYFPSQVPDVAEFVVKVGKKIQEMEQWTAANMGGRKLSDLTDAEIQALGAKFPEFSDFLRGIGWLDKNEIRTQAQLQNAMTRSQQPAVVRDIQDIRAASPTFQREGKVPDWIREWDVRKVYARYASPTINYMYTREPFQIMRNQARLLRQAGATRQADYVDKWASSMRSVPTRSIHSGTSALANKVKIVALRAADRFQEGTPGHGFFQTLAAVPDFLSNITHVIYPNTLGLNPRAILRNLPQTVLMTAPELGGTYGYRNVLRAYVDAAGNWGRLVRDTEKLGLAPERFTAENRDFLRRGVQQSAVYRITDKALDKAGNALMYLYEKSDLLNRAVTLSVAEKWGADLLARDTSAVQALRKAPAGIQRESLALMAQGNQDGLRRLLASHLNSSTQFNYNRASLSEFGRVLGPFFTTFTKWPSEVAGDVYHIYSTKGVGAGSVRLAGKYLLPLAVLGGMQRLLFGHAEDMTDREKKLVGADGLMDWAPIASLTAIAKGDIMTPPVVDVATKMIRGGMAEDADASEIGHRTAAAITQSFVPGAGLLRFFTDDAVTLLTGHRPDGDFLDRTNTGTRKLGKYVGKIIQ